jgi:hypothetical protein
MLLNFGYRIINIFALPGKLIVVPPSADSRADLVSELGIVAECVQIPTLF